MKQLLPSAVLMCSISMTGFAQDEEFRGGGVTVPSINGKANWNNALKGDILLDTSDNNFYGLDNTGTWRNISAVSTPASASSSGYVDTSTQTFAGAKTFSDTTTGTKIAKFEQSSALATGTDRGLAAGSSALSVYGSANQTGITSGVATKVQLNTKEFDTAGFFDSTTNYRWTPAAGKYQVSAVITMNNGASVITADCYLYKNGSLFKVLGGLQNSAGTTGVVRASGSVVVDANGTDYFELYAGQVGSGSWNILGGSSNTYFSASRLP